MEKQKVRIPLSRKMAIMVLAFALALSTVLIAMSYFHYRDEMFDDYEKFATNIAAVAAAQIDPDRIQTWLDTGEPDRLKAEAIAVEVPDDPAPDILVCGEEKQRRLVAV